METRECKMALYTMMLQFTEYLLLLKKLPTNS
jgi:hypothetical protein